MPPERAKHHRIAVIAGDNIGQEIMPEALKALRAAAALSGSRIELTSYPWGADHFLATGSVMPPDGLERLRAHDAVLLGALGDPRRVPDATMSWGLVQRVRKGLDLYVNLRPVQLLPGVRSPLRDLERLDLVVVRENTEGEYAGLGGRLHPGSPLELATQTSVFTRAGIERVVRYAFALAADRPRRRLTSVTKSNAMNHTMTLWDEIVTEIGGAYPQVTTDKYHVDAMAMHLITRPQDFDVIVTTNLFGDILSDQAAALAGGIGLAAGANLNPEGGAPGMFEPIHGSAPDIAGQGIANPLATILAAALMLRQLHDPATAKLLETAVHAVLAEGRVATRDLGGHARTSEVGDAVVAALEKGGPPCADTSLPASTATA